MRGGFAGEFNNRFYSCVFAHFLVQMPSAWEERRAEGDLSVPGGREALFSIHCGRTYGALYGLSNPENGK
jgi:hypothetical protein